MLDFVLKRRNIYAGGEIRTLEGTKPQDFFELFLKSFFCSFDKTFFKSFLKSCPVDRLGTPAKPLLPVYSH